MSEYDIPERYATMLRLGLLDMDSEAVAIAHQNAQETLLVLSGGIGTGKTSAACWWLRKAPVCPSWFVSAALLARYPRYDMADMRRLLRIDRLVIDDLGTEYMDDKGNFMAILDEVVNDRAANDRPTLITTNCDAAAFKERYKDRIADRIRESGKFISVAGASKRHRTTPAEAKRLQDALEQARDEERRKHAEKYTPWTAEQVEEAAKLRRELAESKSLGKSDAR